MSYPTAGPNQNEGTLAAAAAWDRAVTRPPPQAGTLGGTLSPVAPMSQLQGIHKHHEGNLDALRQVLNRMRMLNDRLHGGHPERGEMAEKEPPAVGALEELKRQAHSHSRVIEELGNQLNRLEEL